jgi:hypothetical protein
MKKISLFFIIFLISKAFYASENSLSDRHSRAKETCLEITRKLDNFEQEFSQKIFRLSEEDRNELESKGRQIGAIQNSILRVTFLIHFGSEIDDKLLEGISGSIIVYEQRVKKLEIKYQEMCQFIEAKTV